MFDLIGLDIRRYYGRTLPINGLDPLNSRIAAQAALGNPENPGLPISQQQKGRIIAFGRWRAAA